MKTRVRKWGNSLGVRIPKSFAEQINVVEGAEIDIAVSDGKLVLKPVVAPRYRLEDLVSEIRPSNLHGEVDTGEPVGNELW
ncbi:MAG: AbrB/MazE/SpoVT family DNA-binding domain-containing protein [Candidatus Dadabacteria bacterium]|nr:MAG: AbrB/MazE/SpoVT family DNA-binding domain-containing protein [Candidatus Dadabacteria bacterium]